MVHPLRAFPIGIAVVLLGVCAGLVRMARNDYRAWREKRNRPPGEHHP